MSEDTSNTATTYRYQISLAKVIFDKILLDTRQDSKVAGCFNLAGDAWFRPIQEAIQTSEDTQLSLSIDKSRLYPNPKRSNTPYLTINAQCSLCRKNKVNKYKVSFLKKILENSKYNGC